MFSKTNYLILIFVLHNTGAATKVEVAKRKRTDQSSVENQGVPSRAVDGNTAGLFKDGSCILTKIEDDPWWQVDLGKTMLVTDVVIHNRLDSCCNSMLNKLEIRVGVSRSNNGNSNPVCVSGESLAGQKNGVFTCSPPLSGRFVNIRQEGKGKILTLCEVQVFAEISNQAIVPTTVLPTTAHVHTAMNAVTAETRPPTEGIPNTVESVEVEDITSSSAILSWAPSRPSDPQVSIYYVLYRVSGTTEYNITAIQKPRLFVKLTELKSSSKYELIVLAGNAKGNSTKRETTFFNTKEKEGVTELPPSTVLPLIKNENFQRILAALLAAILLLLLTILILCCRRAHKKGKKRDEENNCSNLKTLAKVRGENNIALELDSALETREQYVLFNGGKNVENATEATSTNCPDETDFRKHYKNTEFEESCDLHYETLAEDALNETAKKGDSASFEVTPKSQIQNSETTKDVALNKTVELRTEKGKDTDENLEKNENRKYFIRQGRLFSLGSRPTKRVTFAIEETDNSVVEAKVEKEHVSDTEYSDYVDLERSKNKTEEEAVVVCKKLDFAIRDEIDECITKLLLQDLGALSSSIRNFGFDSEKLKEDQTL